MSAASDATLGRRELAIIGALWLALSTAFVFANMNLIVGMNLPDADDYLRLQQVRDWLAGQGWFDLTQHRVNPPSGGLLHWSRVVDLPLAAGIAVLTPLIGRETAELVVCVSLPLIIMGVAMWLTAKIAARLVGRPWALLGAACVPLSAVTYPQVMPLRIDHHGWQLVLALTLLWGMTDEANKRRSAIIAGLAAAFWLNISLEGLPIVTVAALVLGVRWMFDARELSRLQTYLWTLTLGSAALETATMPSGWFVAECDRVSQPYLFAFAAASLAAAGAQLPALVKDWRARLGFAGVAGIAAAATFVAAGPQCLAGPFASVDPVTREFWLDRVGESWPLWKHGVGASIAFAGFSLIGCTGAALAIRATQGDARRRWITAFALMLAAGVLMLTMTRAGAVAHAFAAAGAVYLGRMLFDRARTLQLMPLRAVSTVLALVAATPVLLTPALKLDMRGGERRVPGMVCGAAFETLNALSPSLIYAPLDIGPRIIARTPHSVIATGHHRNHVAMQEVITTFTGDVEAARATIEARNAAYIAACADAPEFRTYARLAPEGLAAALAAGRAPVWLAPVEAAPAGSSLLLFSVVDGARLNEELRGRFAFDADGGPRG